jgi:uncharacterized protein
MATTNGNTPQSHVRDPTTDDGIHYTDSKQELSRTVTQLTITPEMFEKLYLTPKTPHVGDNLKRFANPTPLGFVGYGNSFHSPVVERDCVLSRDADLMLVESRFVISTMTFSMVLMGWGGANGASALA